MTGLGILIPLIIGTNNVIAVVFDSIFALVLLGYHSFCICKKIDNKEIV